MQTRGQVTLLHSRLRVETRRGKGGPPRFRGRPSRPFWRSGFTAVLAFLLAALVATAGCGGKSASSGSAGTKGSPGTVSEATLGVPVYPGAVEDDSALEMRRPDGTADDGRPAPPDGFSAPSGSAPMPRDGEGEFTGPPAEGAARGRPTVLWTADSFDGVVQWYRGELSGRDGFSEALPPVREGTSDAGQRVMFTFKSGGTTKSVMISAGTGDEGGTVIMIGGAMGGPPADQGRQSQ